MKNNKSKKRKNKKRKNKKHPIKAIILQINLCKWDLIPRRVVLDNHSKVIFLCLTITVFRK